MSATVGDPDDHIITVLPANQGTIYQGVIPFNGVAQRAVDDFIRSNIRPVRFNNAHVAEPLKKRFDETTRGKKMSLGDGAVMNYSHFSEDALNDMQQSQYFTGLLLDIYENALSLETAIVLDANARVKNPDMIARIQEVGKGLVDAAIEAAGDSEILRLGIYNLLKSCSCIVETHKAYLHAATEHGDDHAIVGVYVSLRQRACSFYAALEDIHEA